MACGPATIRVLAAALLVLASACSAAPADTGETPALYLELSDFKITTDHQTVAAGHVVFGIRNHASMLHEVKVIRTDLAPDALPMEQGAPKAIEEGKVAELLSIASGASRKLVAELSPGKYVIICNVAGHYQLGMRVGLEVK
jgi:uncharacterized cupredoxin-like copper-binding protein